MFMSTSHQIRYKPPSKIAVVMPPVKLGRKVSARNSARYWQDIACENLLRNVSCKFKNVALLNELQ